MKNCSAPESRTRGRILPIACAAALAVASTVSLAQPAHADQTHHVTPPPVPDTLKAPEGTRAFLVGHAVGTQNYICLPSGSGFAWSLFTPEATLFDDQGRQIITHFFSLNPSRAIRATWQHSRDTSTVWAQLTASYGESDFVAPGAIPWLLLHQAGVQDGPASGDHGRPRPGVLTKTTDVQRLNTAGGVAPATGCSVSTDVGSKAFVPYTADYFFYMAGDADDDN